MAKKTDPNAAIHKPYVLTVYENDGKTMVAETYHKVLFEADVTAQRESDNHKIGIVKDRRHHISYAVSVWANGFSLFRSVATDRRKYTKKSTVRVSRASSGGRK